jgi:hypothetical protein
MREARDDFAGRWPPSSSTPSQPVPGSNTPKAQRLREVVLNAIRDAGADGLSSDEAEVALAMMHQTVSARVHELARAGAIVDTGERRRTRSKRLATVWRAAS